MSTGSEQDWQNFSSGGGGREGGGGGGWGEGEGVGWSGDNGESWPQHHGNAESIANTGHGIARKEILMDDYCSPLPPPPPPPTFLDSDSTAVFRECFPSSSPPPPPLLELFSPRVVCLSSECVQDCDERKQLR